MDSKLELRMDFDVAGQLVVWKVVDLVVLLGDVTALSKGLVLAVERAAKMG